MATQKNIDAAAVSRSRVESIAASCMGTQTHTLFMSMLDDFIRNNPVTLAKDGAVPVTCQIYGHVVGHCGECNTGAEADVVATNKVLADNYLRETCAAPKPEASAATQQAGEVMGYAMFRDGAQQGVERFKEQADLWVDATAVPLGPIAAPISEDTGKGEAHKYAAGSLARKAHDAITDGKNICASALAALDRPAQSGNIGGLPPLPEPHWVKSKSFSDDQMRVYGQACIAADRAARTPASVGSIWDEEEFRKTLMQFAKRFAIEPVFSEEYMKDRNALIAYIDTRASQMLPHDGRHVEAAPRNAGVDSLSPGSEFMVHMDSVLRFAESHEGGRISTKAVRNWILNYQSLLDPARSVAPDTRDALTDDEIHDLMSQTVDCEYHQGIAFARAILAKSKGQAA